MIAFVRQMYTAFIAARNQFNVKARAGGQSKDRN